MIGRRLDLLQVAFGKTFPFRILRAASVIPVVSSRAKCAWHDERQYWRPNGIRWATKPVTWLFKSKPNVASNMLLIGVF